jgi:hypothetical protein
MKLGSREGELRLASGNINGQIAGEDVTRS